MLQKRIERLVRLPYRCFCAIADSILKYKLCSKNTSFGRRQFNGGVATTAIGQRCKNSVSAVPRRRIFACTKEHCAIWCEFTY